jgi:type II secretory pathway component PulF
VLDDLTCFSYDFKGPALSDKSHMHLEGAVADLIGTLAWAAKNNIPFPDALSDYVPKKRKWGPPLSLKQQKIMFKKAESEIAGSKGIFNIRLDGNWKWHRFLERLNYGEPLSSALQVFNNVVPQYLIGAIRHAELQNNLRTVLPLLAERMHHDESARREWKMLMIYPAVQLLITYIILTGLLLFIVPNFIKIFAELLAGDPLPSMLFFIKKVSIYMRMNFLSIDAIIFILGLLYVVSLRLSFWSNCFFWVPGWGLKLREHVLYEIAKSMNSFITAGCDVIEAAEATLTCQRCFWARIALRKFINDTKSGMKWIDAWEKHLNIGKPIHLWIIRNAASREKIDEGFVHLQNWLGEDLHFFSVKLKNTFEVSLTLFNAVIVGTIVLSLGVPLWRIIYYLSA